MMEWDAWIGQDDPVEVKPLAPPPHVEELETESAQRSNELRNRAEIFRRESGSFRLPSAKYRSDFTPEEEKLDPELIKGLFRMNQKMILAGASKSGKSFMLIELALCLASGTPWIGYECKECKVLYVNLEIAGASFIKRVDDVSRIMELGQGTWNENLKILNMRGVHTNIEEMRGALIAEIISEEAETGVPYGAVILDPIYKISNGEENSAKDVGAFCANIDVICKETGAAVIFSHHHSKGDQGYKSAQDRASGSGVFARDPDTMIDMIELDIDKDTYGVMKNSYASEYWATLLDKSYSGWRDEVSEDDLNQSGALAQLYKTKAKVTDRVIAYMSQNVEADFQESMKGATPLRLEFTLREFASPDPVNMFFRYPIHILDDKGVLEAADPKSHIQGEKKEKVRAVRKSKTASCYEAMVHYIMKNGFVTYADLKAELDLMDRQVRTRVDDVMAETDEFEKVKGGGKNVTRIYFRGEAPEEKNDEN